MVLTPEMNAETVDDCAVDSLRCSDLISGAQQIGTRRACANQALLNRPGRQADLDDTDSRPRIRLHVAKFRIVLPKWVDAVGRASSRREDVRLSPSRAAHSAPADQATVRSGRSQGTLMDAA
ncbi:hypothetical protein IU450_22250 [Nocardia abscessus]|uniref:hypothetical protein n=1 Tax=Nocardia abscessus TaxID=120957 RepID=UPI001895FE00|nr:hypothetical protein [Nocardia abscessus]MBF6338594.1 hypothetical protein [Nocardia abscessus]